MNHILSCCSSHVLFVRQHLLRALHLVILISLIVPNFSISLLGPEAPARMDHVLAQTEETPTPTEPIAIPPAETEPVVSASTITPTLTLTPTATLELEGTPTPTLAITPTLPVETPTPTDVLPTETIPSPTATLPVTDSLPTLQPTQPISLTMTADTRQVSPGGVVVLSWQIAGWTEAMKSASYSLSVQPPAGFTPFGETKPEYDAASSAYKLSTQFESDDTVWQIPPDLPGPYTFTLQMSRDDTALVQRTITLEETGLTRLPPEGGAASGLDGRVSVFFPEKAAGEALDVRIRPPVPANRPSYTLSENPFEIVATGATSGLEVHQFTQPITITVAYTGVQDLSVFYYEPKEATWLPLYTVYDREAGLLHAQSDHLSVFDTDVNNWQAAEMPTVDEAQVSAQTGAASYSYDLWTPPGPGGLQPSLSLTYNSQVVDGKVASVSQSSWVGMGWSLDAGYVERDMHGTMDDGTDDTFNLVLNGTSSQILRAVDTKYYMADDRFWKLDFTTAVNIWTIWDKEGNKYTFGKTDASRGLYPRYNCPTQTNSTWRWMLAEVENRFGKKLTYTYLKDPKLIDDPCNTGSDPADIAIYPDTITYPNNRYRVVFDLEDSPLRTDYKSEWWNNDDYRIFFSRYRLDRVWIQHDPDGTGPTGWQTVRTYDLYYEDSGTLFPGYNWSAGGKTFALTKIQEIGSNGATLRLATVFSYSDVMHLSKVDNNYGGSVTFDYEDTPWADVDTFAENFSNLDACEGGWTGSVTCVSGYNQVNGSGSYDFKNFHPGGVYYLEVSLRNTATSGSKTATVKLQYGNDAQNNIIWLMNNETIPAQTTVTRSTQITLDRYSSMLRWVVTTSGGALRIVSFKLKLLPTRYKVSSREVKDTSVSPNQDYFYYYEYDEPATNDAAHSVAVAGENPSIPDLYVDAYQEYRGVAMSREIGPTGSDGSQRVTTTWYHQDDYLKGRPSVSIVGTQSYGQQFTSTLWSDYSSEWSYLNGVAPVFERLSGDVTAKIQGTGTGWDRALYRTPFSLTDGEGIVAHFRLEDATAQSVLAVTSGAIGSDYYRWGVKANGTNLVTHTCVTSDTNCTDGLTPLMTGLVADAWYVIQILIDDEGNDTRFLVRVWQREEPAKSAQVSEVVAGKAARSWRFMDRVYAGTVYLDEYSEGYLYSLSIGEFKSTVQRSLYTEMTQWRDLAMLWTRTLTETAMTFEGDASWVGTRTTFEYNTSDQGGSQGGTQFGNLTRQVEAKWTGSAWESYRASRTNFYPYTSTTVNLTGLPARTSQYKCNSGVCGYADGDLLGQHWFLYDGATLYSTPPSLGKLTAERTLLYCVGDNCTPTANLKFSDFVYTYDAYGNRIIATAYSAEGTYSALATTGARSVTTCYGVANTPTGCTNDGYYTYPIWEKNALTHQTTTSYTGSLYPGSSHTGYALGVPTSQTDPNNATTSATYDTFGRLLSITRPLESGGATITINYNDDDGAITLPFYTQATQKVDALTNYTIRKLYNGLGQLVETHVVNASLASGVKDILVDYDYDSYGNAYRQTVPVEQTPWGGAGSAYRGSLFAESPRNYTKTVSDLLGRPLNITAPDTTYTARYTYLDLETQVIDARDKLTRNLLDEWGRTVQVIPPAGPSVSYTYDAADRLELVVKGSTTIDPSYDKAGRKTGIIDPDMGTWSYGYDALGNLTGQTDARGCATTLVYDLLNRPTSKSFSGTGCATTGVTYTYDQGTNGIGRRTAMTDSSGSASWTYDARGRMTGESKVVSGVATFVTGWTYNSADLVSTMTYPSNGGTAETVTYAYHPQMLLSTAIGSTTYVKNTTYDAAGRVDVRSLGQDLAFNPRVKTDYDYFAWTSQGGRLQYLRSGVYNNITSLQYLEYAYDAVGNVDWIKDRKAGSDANPQLLDFTYDDLNRLDYAVTSGGDGLGAYNEDYNYDSQGRLSYKGGVTLGYAAQSGSCPAGALSKAHAVTTAGSNTYCYDQNGNMVKRNIGSTYDLTYDAANHLIGVTGTGVNASFVYDGDGNRVKGTVANVTTVYVGAHFEWNATTTTPTKYYYAGSIRIAMRSGAGTGESGLLWLLGDHLSSTSRVANADGTPYTNGEQRYKPWGEKRYPTGASGLPTTYRFTGQRQEIGLGPSGGEGLYFFNARWYDPALGRFASADTIVPGAGNPMAFDRYAYANNNPLIYVDPSGHTVDCPSWDTTCLTTSPSSPEKIAQRYGVKFKNRMGYWSLMNKYAAIHAIMFTARKLAGELGGNISAIAAFNKIYRGIELIWDTTHAVGGEAESTHSIIFGGLSEPTQAWGGHRSTIMAFINSRNNIVHELGHAFAQVWWARNPDTGELEYLDTGPLANIPSELINNEGFYPNPGDEKLTWRQHPCTAATEAGCGSEVFADMFLGWTFDKWGNDPLGVGNDRRVLMTDHMDNWSLWAANR